MTKRCTHLKNKISSNLKSKFKFLVVALALVSGGLQAQLITTYTTGSGTFPVPTGVTNMTVECWGGGGAGGSAQSIGTSIKVNVKAGGGAGGSYAKTDFPTPSAGNYSYSVGAGGYVGTNINTAPVGFANDQAYNGASTTFIGTTNVYAIGGLGGESKIVNSITPVYGIGGAKQTTGNTGTVQKYGGAGGVGEGTSTTQINAAGGGSAGSLGDGGNATANNPGSAGNGGGATGATPLNSTLNIGVTGSIPGGGGSGASLTPTNATGISDTFRRGGNGGNGQVKITLDITSLTIASGETLSIPTGATLYISLGSSLNLLPGAKINNEGAIVNDGTINFLSDVTNGTATIIGLGTISGSGVENVNQSFQHAAGLRSWYISSPINANYAPTPTLSVIKSFNETNENGTSWISTTTMAPKKGYMVTPANATNNLLFSGKINSGNQTIVLSSRTGSDNKAGFNLIGNPYLSYLDWNAVTTANAGVFRSTTMWYRTKNAGTYSFWTVNGDGIGTPNGASASIPPMQAFWVRAIEGGSLLNLTNSMRLHAPTTDKLLKAPALSNRTLLRLQVSNGTNTDETVIYTSENAQNGLDNLDAPKMSNNNENIPEIYTTLGTEKIVINSFNSLPLNSRLSLGFVAGNASLFSIKAIEIKNIPVGVKVILSDNVTATETDLTDASAIYEFTPKSTSEDRFSIIFRTAGNITGVNNTAVPKAQVFVNANNQIVINTIEKTNYAIYNATGIKVSQGKTSQATLITPRFAAGMYVVKINAATTKVIIK